MRIGFTGSREGMTDNQVDKFGGLIIGLKPSEFHHGDCVGSDEMAHEIVREVMPECRILIHPPTLRKFRAFCEGDYHYQVKPYLERNRDIVACTDLLIATPNGLEKRRSGTWATIRHARDLNLNIEIIYPTEESK